MDVVTYIIPLNFNNLRRSFEMLAYHSDATLKREMLAELAEHRKLDQLVKGTYGKGSNGDFRGCAVGCSIHSLNRKRGTKYAYGDHEAYEAGFGIPRQLAYLEDRIFENLTVDFGKWPERFMRAITPGADLSLVAPKFMLWLLVDSKDGVVRFAGKRKDLEAAIERVAELYRRALKGEIIAPTEWNAASYAASHAASHAAASDARQKHWVKMSDKLIALLKAA